TTINESIIVKYRSFAGQANPVRLRMTKMWGFHSNDKKREKCFFTQSDAPATPDYFRKVFCSKQSFN
ncbi:MAG: hypothetical protein ACOCG5_08930, partial [Candidatus Alkaliphilus sp. MAG34]